MSEGGHGGKGRGRGGGRNLWFKAPGRDSTPGRDQQPRGRGPQHQVVGNKPPPPNQPSHQLSKPPTKQASKQQSASIWYLDKQEGQDPAFPAALGQEDENGSIAYDLTQMPIIYEEDLASARVSIGDSNSYWVEFSKPLFWWRVTNKHYAAGLAPSDTWKTVVPGACLQQLSLKDLVNLRDLFLRMFNMPNGVEGREKPNSKNEKCKSEPERKEAWERLKHMYQTMNLKEAYGAIPEELLDHFRVDVYGNVVALDAVSGSPAAFSMDHIMPWSKGGRTTANNLMALSEAANSAKSNTLHNFIIQQQRRQVPQEDQQAALPSTTSSPASPPSAFQAKVVSHLLIKGEKKPSGKVMYYLQPMPSGLQVPELSELWQHIKGVPSEGDKSPSQGSVANPAEDEQQQAAHKERLEMLKTLLCQPWPGMLKVRHEKRSAITGDGMHSIMFFFMKVARKFASALPAIELTAQRVRGEPLLDTAPDASSTGSAASGEEGHSSGDADLTSEDGAEGGEGEGMEDEEEEEEVDVHNPDNRDALPTEPAPPSTNLQPHPLPPTPVSGEQHQRILSADTLSSVQNNIVPLNFDGALQQQNSIGDTAPPPQQYPSPQGDMQPTSPLSTHSPPDFLPLTSPVDPSRAHTLSPPANPITHTPPHLPGSLHYPDAKANINCTISMEQAQPAGGAVLKDGQVTKHPSMEPTPSAVHSPTSKLLPPPRPKFWVPQLGQPSNPYIQLAPPELLHGPEPHPLPFSSGALLAHQRPQHSLAATPVGTQLSAPTHLLPPIRTQPHPSAPRTAAQLHTHVDTSSGTGVKSGAPGANVPLQSPTGTGKLASIVPPHPWKADSMWVGGWDAAALPKRRPPPPATHSTLPSFSPSTPQKVDSTWVGGSDMAEVVPEHHPPHPAARFNFAPVPPSTHTPSLPPTPLMASSPPAPSLPSTQAKPHTQPRKLTANWLRSLLCFGAKAAGKGAPVAPGGPHNSRNHNRVAPS